MFASRTQFRISYRSTAWLPSRPTIVKVFTQPHLAEECIRALRERDDGTLQLSVDEREATYGPWSPSKIGGGQ